MNWCEIQGDFITSLDCSVCIENCYGCEGDHLSDAGGIQFDPKKEDVKRSEAGRNRDNAIYKFYRAKE